MEVDVETELVHATHTLTHSLTLMHTQIYTHTYWSFHTLLQCQGSDMRSLIPKKEHHGVGGGIYHWPHIWGHPRPLGAYFESMKNEKEDLLLVSGTPRPASARIPSFSAINPPAVSTLSQMETFLWSSDLPGTKKQVNWVPGWLSRLSFWLFLCPLFLMFVYF